ncbi:Chitin synthase 6 [Zalerion maritima]|uniref:chitin synthase n=1 Tax=Zalerion maritima TaxID=339359 RepID=A0AAD5S0E3_9PEZI|nr:Chitin synthase 6 [Zalerion maritima]
MTLRPHQQGSPVAGPSNGLLRPTGGSSRASSVRGTAQSFDANHVQQSPSISFEPPPIPTASTYPYLLYNNPSGYVSHGTSVTGGTGNTNWSFQSSIQQEEAKLRWNSDEELKQVSKSLLRLQKYALIFGLISLNAALVYVAWTYDEVYYIFIVLLSCNTMLQALMILCIVLHALIKDILCYPCRAKPEKPETPEKMVWLLPCYNETHQELSRSLESLIAQKNVEEHPKLIFIVVDGNVRGPGMTKTTQGYLLEDILESGTKVHFENGYRARDGLFMPVDIQTGFFHSIPYLFVGKRYNQGKRDSLCFARSFLYHFQSRSQNLVTIFSQDLFDYMGNAFVQAGVDQVDYLCGMDADTVFDQYCVHEMLLEIRKNPKLVGVCGHVCVDFDDNNWGLWSLYQSVEYSQTQGLRRMFQSRITGKVNCLPGCCQLIRVCEATFGDQVLRERFGYCPKPNDLMTQHIMGNYSEDSIHASIIFSLFPQNQTAQALRAKAFTIVPQNWKVFLSQRKRWALGSISNEFVMIFRPGIIAIERLQSIIAVMTWAITPFIISAVVELLILMVKRGKELWSDSLFLGLICILFFRYLYSLCIVFWLPRNTLERGQYFVGFFAHFLSSPVLNMVVLIYSLIHSDDFKWGKTREVIQSEKEMAQEHGRPAIH